MDTAQHLSPVIERWSIEGQSEEIRRRISNIGNIHIVDRPLVLGGCAEDVVQWINDWVFTYDPNALELTDKPFVLFPRQVEMMRWVEEIIQRREEGILEKSREIGASWCMAMFALHRWLFKPGFRTTFGSYKAEKVDLRGDSGSIFEKLRIALDMLPSWMRPDGYRPSEHDNYMRLLNPANGNQIIGEVGDNMGRGSRSSLFVLDEAAFLENARAANRAISRNADARIWASTPSPLGMASVFYGKREHAIERDPTLVFRFHYSDDPRRDDAWIAAKKAQMDVEDWAAEQEIDYSGATERALIRAPWVEAGKKLWREADHGTIMGECVAGFDPGAGKAESSLVVRRGPLAFQPTAWRDPDSVDSSGRALDAALALGATKLNYDATGVGFAQGSIMTRSADSYGLKIVGVMVGNPAPGYVRLSDGRGADDVFANLKAFGWWTVRERLKKSWELVEGLEDHPLNECLLVPPDNVLCSQLCQPTWSKTLAGKRQVDKMPLGAKSPDRADALVLAFLERDAPGQWTQRRLLGV
jgi:hypothetical protein